MKILVACEFSGIVRNAFAARGHDAWSCDIEPSELPGNHIQGDVLDILREGWDMMIAHPPCTYLSRAGARWWKLPERQEKMREAAAFVRALYDAPIPYVAIENPRGALNKLWRYPDQTIQPYQFGHPYSKATCLWLKNLPVLLYSVYVPEYQALMQSNTGKGKKAGQKWQRGVTRSSREASRTFPGVAAAMAQQWGDIKPPAQLSLFETA